MKVYIYRKKKEVTLWRKQNKLWFKFLPETPKFYADMMAKLLEQAPDYKPCWWGNGETPPEDEGYTLLYKVEMQDITSEETVAGPGIRVELFGARRYE